MAYSDAIIIDEVKMPEDIAAVLGITANELEDICKSASVKLFSKYKPTDWKTHCFNNKTEPGMADSQWKGEITQYNGTNIRANCGISVPYALLPDSLFTAGEDYAFFNTNQYRNVPATLINQEWSKITPTVFRLNDFYKYCHTTPSYPIARGKYPISFSNLTVQTLKYNTLQQSGSLLVVAEIHFDYNDISVKNIAYWLGVKNLLDSQSGTGYNLKFGFILCSDLSAQNVHFAVTNEVEMTLDPNYDQTTGLVGYRNIALEDAPLLKPAFNDGFQVNEKVYIIPYIRRSLNIGGVNYRCYFGLNIDSEHLAYQQFTIRNSGLTVQSVSLIGAGLTIAYQKVQTKASSVVIRFWVANIANMVFTFSGYSQFDYSNKFYFLTTDFGIMRNDDQGYLVNQNIATLGQHLDSDIDTRYSNINTQQKNATGLLDGVIDNIRLAAYYTEYEYSNTSTSAKVGAQIIFMDKQGNEMVQRSVSFSGTINPSTTPDTQQSLVMTTVIH